MPRYTVQDTESGRTVTFEWSGVEPPTDADMAEVFAAAKDVAPKGAEPVADAPSLLSRVKDAAMATGPQRIFQRENLPTTLAAVGGALTGGLGAIPAMAGAAMGGSAGAALNALREGRLPTRDDVAMEGAKQGALAGVGAGASKAAEAVGAAAVPMVRSALKPVFSTLRKRAGIEGTTPAALANTQARFIVDKGLRTPEQADALVKSSGQQVDDAIRAAESDPNVSPVLDTANRIPRYLNGLLRRVEGTILPGKDRAAIQNVGRELVNDSPLSQATAVPPRRPANDVLQEAADTLRANGPSAAEPRTLRGPEGVGQSASYESRRPRALRANVRPSEGMALVRSKSFFDKNASGGQVAGGKAIERAVRDAIKEAVPATRAPLATQGRALDARELLDRANWRDSNRDAAGMGAIAGVANGRPLTGLLLQLIKEGQLGMGITAGAVGRRAPQIGGGATGLARLINLWSEQDANRPDQ